MVAVVCVQSTAKHPVYEELTPAKGSLIDKCSEEPAESDQDSLHTDEEIDNFLLMTLLVKIAMMKY